MNSDSFRRLIETGDLAGLESALAADSGWANRTVEWFLNQKNESDPLHYVSDCVFNHALGDVRASEIAALLIEHGALVDGSDGRESPLIGAASLGAESVAKLLVDSGANLEATAVFGARALHWAAAMGLPALVAVLIDRGAELEAKCSEHGATPLYWAVFGCGPHGPNKKQDPLAAAKVLLGAGADIDTANHQGVTALECAKNAESGEIYELLVRSS